MGLLLMARDSAGEMTEFVNSRTVLAVKLDLKCSCEKAYLRFWPVLCRLCVGNEEGSDCAGSAIMIWNSSNRVFFL